MSTDVDHDFSFYIKPVAGIFFFLVMAWVNIVRRKEIYKINETGIYYQGNLITNWAHFYTAYVDDDSNAVSVDDDIKIVLQYYNSEGLLLEQRLPAPYNLDHSFYEIIEAIELNRNYALNLST